MTKVRYIKDTGKFWRERADARTILDAKRSQASRAEKAKTSHQLHSDASFLKSGRILASKP